MLGLANSLLNLLVLAGLGYSGYRLTQTSPQATIGLLLILGGAFVGFKLLKKIFPSTADWVDRAQWRLVVIRELFVVGFLFGAAEYIFFVLLDALPRISTWDDVKQVFLQPPEQHPLPFLMAIVIVAIPTLVGLVAGRVVADGYSFSLVATSRISSWFITMARFRVEIPVYQAPVRGRGVSSYQQAWQRVGKAKSPSLWVRFKWRLFLFRKSFRFGDTAKEEPKPAVASRKTNFNTPEPSTARTRNAPGDVSTAEASKSSTSSDADSSASVDSGTATKNRRFWKKVFYAALGIVATPVLIVLWPITLIGLVVWLGVFAARYLEKKRREQEPEKDPKTEPVRSSVDTATDGKNVQNWKRASYVAIGIVATPILIILWPLTLIGLVVGVAVFAKRYFEKKRREENGDEDTESGSLSSSAPMVTNSAESPRSKPKKPDIRVVDSTSPPPMPKSTASTAASPNQQAKAHSPMDSTVKPPAQPVNKGKTFLKWIFPEEDSQASTSPETNQPATPVPPIPKVAPPSKPKPKAVARKRAIENPNATTEGLTFFWAYLLLPFSEATGHFLVTGTPGSGKTIQLRLLMQSVFKLMGNGLNQRALIYDGKREYIPVLQGMELQVPIHILNPFDARSVSWDMAADITTPASAQQVASILVPQENSSQPFFTDATRQLLYGVLYALLKKAPGKWTLRDVLLICRNKQRLYEVLELTEETREIRDIYFAEPKTLLSVLSTVATKLAPFSVVAALWDTNSKPGISLSTWLDEESILVLGNNPAHSQSIQPINQVIFRRLSDLLLSQPDSKVRRAWLFLDELREAGKLDGLSSLLNQGRSKGVCSVLGFQDIDGLRAVYGDKIASEITGQCRNKSFLRTDSSATAKWAEEHFGQSIVLEQSVTQSSNSNYGSGNTSHGSSHTTATSQQLRHMVLASEIMGQLPPSPATGFRGVHDVPSVGTFPTHMSWNYIFGELRDEKGESEQERDPSDQDLRSWSEADSMRLGFTEKSEVKTSGVNPLMED